MRKASNLSSMKELIADAIERYGLAKRTTEERAASHWAQVVGDRVAAASRVEAVRDGTMFVNCKNSTWAQELAFLKERIIKGLNERVGRGTIKDIRFSGSGLRGAAEAAAGEEEGGPSPKEIQEIKLSGAEQARICESVEGVTDPSLAERIRAAIESRHKLEQWRSVHGRRKRGRSGKPPS